MARFQVWARNRNAQEEKLFADVDSFGAQEDRRIRRALRSRVDVYIIDTDPTTATDPKARYTMLLGGRTDPDPTPDGDVT
jgi:hypothetical protein